MSQEMIRLPERITKLYAGEQDFNIIQMQDSPQDSANIELVLDNSIGYSYSVGDIVTFQLNDFFVECPVLTVKRSRDDAFDILVLDMRKCVPTDMPELLRVLEPEELDLDAEFDQ